MKPLESADIFCDVIDNFGDAGVSWRLARSMVATGMSVRLWINDLSCLKRLRPLLDDSITEQILDGFTVVAWNDQSEMNYQPANLVIEAFGCRLSESMIRRMSEANPSPVWINLEYLSAESWTVKSHGLPSPHPRLPITQYFFFPGFVPGSGGLLREKDLLPSRTEFTQEDRRLFLNKLGVGVSNDTCLVSLFCYEHAPIDELFKLMRRGPPTLCLVPESVAMNKIAHALNGHLSVGSQVTQGQLTIHIIPFLDPDDYDRLLWSCDVNFVRGEDSVVRAHWAQQPFVWQLYQQDSEAHLIKLAAFLDLYCPDMSEEDVEVVSSFWEAWNGKAGVNLDWVSFSKVLTRLAPHHKQWASKVASVDALSTQLIRFASKIR